MRAPKCTSTALWRRILGRPRRWPASPSRTSERQQYTRALKFARRAVKRAPGSAKHRLLLGDAFFKVYDYRAAQREYLEAQRLGSRAAAKRLTKLEGKLGP